MRQTKDDSYYKGKYTVECKVNKFMQNMTVLKLFKTWCTQYDRLKVHWLQQELFVLQLDRLQQSLTPTM